MQCLLDYEKEKYESHCAVFIDQGPTKIFKMHFKLCLLRMEGSDLATQFKFLFKYQKESGEELAIEKKKGSFEKSLLCLQFFQSTGPGCSPKERKTLDQRNAKLQQRKTR